MNGSIEQKLKKVTINAKDEILSVTSKFLPYSDFGVLSLLCWNDADENSFFTTGDTVVIKINDYLTNNPVFSFLGSTHIEQTVSELLSETTMLKFIPENIVEKISKSNNYLFKKDRDSFDYIVDTDLIKQMEGSGYKKLRRCINNFQLEYPKTETKVIDLNEKNQVTKIMELSESWCDLKEFDKKQKESDLKAIQRFIEYSEFFNTLTVGLFDGDKLIAFTFNEIINNDWAFGHFGKSITEYKGSSHYLERETSIILNNLKVKYSNIQQDTGLSGLREAKMTYNPNFFLEKYTISCGK